MRKVAVIGSSGAIGRAFVDHYINDLSINSIFSFSRSSIGIDNNKVKHFSIDTHCCCKSVEVWGTVE